MGADGNVSVALRNYFGSFAEMAAVLRESSTGWKAFSDNGPTHSGDSVKHLYVAPDSTQFEAASFKGPEP